MAWNFRRRFFCRIFFNSKQASNKQIIRGCVVIKIWEKVKLNFLIFSPKNCYQNHTVACGAISQFFCYSRKDSSQKKWSRSGNSDKWTRSWHTSAIVFKTAFCSDELTKMEHKVKMLLFSFPERAFLIRDGFCSRIPKSQMILG